MHVPGAVHDAHETPGKVSFRVEAWPRRPYFILVNGLTQKPRVKINGKAAALTGSNRFQEKEGRLILQLEGNSSIGIRME